MDLKDILAISGYPGLFKMVAQTRNGVIVESLTDGKRMPAYASSKISSLEDIAIYTEVDEVPLKEVFAKIFEVQGGAAAPKASSSANELKAFFESVLEDYDKDRVYVSDIKRVTKWYNLLLEKGMITEESLKAVAEETKEEEKVEEPAEEKAE